MKQCKEECELVMAKLARIVEIVINVAESCKEYDLNEGDLSAGLHTNLQSLKRFANVMVILRAYCDEEIESWMGLNVY